MPTKGLGQPAPVNRYYDPATDQFLSIDPDVAETGQPYAYTGDDPLNATDPLGLQTKYFPRRWTHKTMPRVQNYQLKRILRQLYQSNERLRGGTAAAIRQEARTGKPVGGRFHEVKGMEKQTQIQKVLQEPEKLSRPDRLVARSVLVDLSEAQSEFDAAAAAGRFRVGKGPGELTQNRYSQAVVRFQADIDQTALGTSPARGEFDFGGGSEGDGFGGSDPAGEVPDL